MLCIHHIQKLSTKTVVTKCSGQTVTPDLASAVHLHSSTEEEDHILQTALPTCPHQPLWQLIYMLVEKCTLMCATLQLTAL